MAGATKTAYSKHGRAPAEVPGRPGHPMAGAAWLAAVPAHRDAVTELSPWMYGLGGNGQIDTQFPAGQGAAVARDIHRLRAAGLRVVASIANITDGKWAYRPVGRMLHSPALMAQQVAAIVALVPQHDYAGVDIETSNAGTDPRNLAQDYAAIPAAWLPVSNGRWKSPARRLVGRAPAAPLPAAGLPAGGSYPAGTRDEPGTPAPAAEASHVSG